MKRVVSLLAAFSLMLSLLAACRPPAAQSDPPETVPTDETAPTEVELSCGRVLIGIWGELGIELSNSETYGVSYAPDAVDDRETKATYIEGAYRLAEGEWEDAAIARETGASAVEMAVLRFADEDEAKHGEKCLKDYLHGRERDFTGYAPAQAKLAADAALVREGRYVGLFIVEASDYAGQVFSEIIRTGEIPEPTPEPEPVDDVNELLDILLDSCKFMGDDISSVERVDGSDPERLKSILEEEYHLVDYSVEEAVIARGTNDSVFELAVLRVAEGEDAWRLCDVLTREYLDVKEEEYTRFPAQAEMLGEAIAGALNSTGFVVMAVCSNPNGIMWNAIKLLGTNGYSSATRHFDRTPVPSVEPDSTRPDRVKFDPPNEDDMSIYDTSAIRAAWAAGDPAGLSREDRAVYDAAKRILDEIITDGMADLERETAIYHWLVNHVDYDWRHQDVMLETPRTAFEPYGGLVDHMAVCLGYASSFQLLMDLAGVECITVVGACFRSTGDHAWNMVRLNGEWYCVDVTWDSNYREQGASTGQKDDWRWFNVTSDKMADTNHQWDYASVPEATAEDHGRP